MSKRPKAKDRDAQMGRMLVNIYESGYLDRNTMYKMSFLKGVAAGLGGIVGATIIVALLLWILTWFSQVPLIGHFTDKVTQTVEQAK